MPLRVFFLSDIYKWYGREDIMLFKKKKKITYYKSLCRQ
jgi:hypothetical protein